jgi:hypothetical protein
MAILFFWNKNCKHSLSSSGELKCSVNFQKITNRLVIWSPKTSQLHFVGKQIVETVLIFTAEPHVLIKLDINRFIVSRPSRLK